LAATKDVVWIVEMEYVNDFLSGDRLRSDEAVGMDIYG
jgi:hypothetical protein